MSVVSSLRASFEHPTLLHDTKADRRDIRGTYDAYIEHRRQRFGEIERKIHVWTDALEGEACNTLYKVIATWAEANVPHTCIEVTGVNTHRDPHVEDILKNSTMEQATKIRVNRLCSFVELLDDFKCEPNTLHIYVAETSRLVEEEREKQHTGHEHAHTTKQMAHYDAMAISAALNFRGVYQLPSPSTVVYGARYNPEGLISELTIGPHKNDGKLCPEAVRAVYKVTEAREHMRKLAVERALFLIPDPIPIM